MNGLWWIPIGLAAWLAAGLGLGLLIGPVLRRNSQDDSLDVDIHHVRSHHVTVTDHRG